MITREELADLRVGDVVERAYDSYPDTVLRGPLRDGPAGSLRLGSDLIRYGDGSAWNGYLRLLTVISRAPRPLYVNHPRTEPVEGDIVRDSDGDAWLYSADEWFVATAQDEGDLGIESFKPLTLLWDGETGRAVTS